MLQSKLYILLVLISMTISLSADAQKINFVSGDWKDIKKSALEADKPIFVDAFTTWCGPCKWMDKNVFTDEDVIDFYNANFINYQLDMEKGEGPEFAITYGVNAYPTLLYISGNGEIVHKMVGSLPPAKFIETGKVAVDPSRNIGSLMTEYKGGNKEPAFLKKYLKALYGANMDASDVAEEYISTLTDAELIDQDNYLMMIQAVEESGGMKHPFYNTIYIKREAFGKLIGKKNVMNDLVMIAKNDVYKSILMQDEANIKMIEQRLERMEEDIQGEVMNFYDLIMAERKGDHEAVVKSLTENFKKYSKDDWQALNSMAWNIYEDEKNADAAYLKLGLKMAKKSIKLESNYYNTDTYAALLYKSGNLKKAEKYALMAINFAKKSKEDFSETEHLLEKIRSGKL